MSSADGVKKNRSLQLEEVKRLIASDNAAKKAAELDRRTSASMNWPGSYNLRLLAEAVGGRREFVVFEPHKRFKIRYDSRFKAVFIRPEGKDDFVPCGWFTYDRLKEYMTEDGNSE